MKKDNRKIRTLESIYESIGISFNEYFFQGYIAAHMEQLYLGTRKVVAVNINGFNSQEEGMIFILKCCKEFNCEVVFVDQGEIWVVNKDLWYYEGEIPSRFSENKEDHILRGKLLGYPDRVINSYFL